jgi:pimeloyl-ACP methyl ester carboxylesterase
MRDDLLGFLDALGLDRVVLVGHSMGGTVAWLFAPHHGDRLSRMVIVDVAPSRPGDPKIDVRPRPDDWDRPAEYEAVAAVLAQLNDPDPAWTSDLARITTPTLVVAGGEKSHVDQARLAEIVASLPDAHLVTIPVGHGVHKDAPDEFVAAVQDFLAP